MPQLWLLDGVTGESAPSRPEPVREVPTDHYRVTADLNRAAGRQPKLMRESIRLFVAAVGRTRLPMDVWLDDQGLVRRFTVAYNLDGPLSKVPGAGLDVRAELYDFGIPVRIAQPPPEEIIELSELVG
jgi:hypothetical protein